MVIAVVGLKKKKKKKKPTVLRCGLKILLKLDLLQQDGEAVESPQEAKAGRMSDTCLAFPTTSLRIDDIGGNFCCTRCLSSFD